jgi:hypothetical protein
MRFIRARGRLGWLLGLGLALALGAVFSPLVPTLAQSQGDDDVQPAPPSIGADVPLTYFGPSPSQVQKELVGPVQLLKSGTIDFDEGTITLPLYRGETRRGQNVWYIVTDTNDRDQADALGLLPAPKLSFADVGRGARTATLRANGLLVFDQGTVDFSPEHQLVPGPEPNPFPPRVFTPGAVGDQAYSPLVKIKNAGGRVYNAPIIAFGVSAEQLRFPEGQVDHSIVHDRVVAIDPGERGIGTVTLDLATGFSFSKPVFYLSLDASEPLPATMEGVTLAPGLRDLPLGRDDSLFSPVERLFTVTNGPRGTDNPQRQGFNSAVAGEGDHLPALGGIPTVATDYSPLWDVQVGEWTERAIARGFRSRQIEEFQFLGNVQRGHITGPGGTEFGSAGFIVNCPVVHRFL